jgi:hypothetical protein
VLDRGARCQGCAEDGDCGEAFCNPEGACEPERPLVTVCAGDNECMSSHCPEDDNICCEEACDGQCASCLHAHTGQPNGECHPILKKTDPDLECRLVGNLFRCNGDGACTLGGS